MKHLCSSTYSFLSPEIQFELQGKEGRNEKGLGDENQLELENCGINS
jgi:hypothetical protein